MRESGPDISESAHPGHAGHGFSRRRIPSQIRRAVQVAQQDRIHNLKMKDFQKIAQGRQNTGEKLLSARPPGNERDPGRKRRTGTGMLPADDVAAPQ